jgi:hypothetical protein
MALTYVLFSISQIFGRAPDLRSTIEIFRKFFYEQGSIYLDITTLVFAIFGLMLVLLKDINDEFFGGKYSLFASKSISIRFSSYIIVMFAIILFGVFADKSFIYFQF